MKNLKKGIALLLVLILAFSNLALSGCGNKEKDPDTDEQSELEDETGTADEVVEDEEPITLTVYSQTANYSGEQIGWFGQVLLEKFNVKINIVNDADGVFVTRMESGDLGDIVFFGSDSDDYIQAVDKGMLFDWNEDDLLTEYGPYIKENMSKALEKNAGISSDGKVYGFGYGVATSALDHESFFYHPDIRWDLYKQIGYPAVTTLEDYIDVLTQMKEICPTSDSGKETYGVSLFNDWDGHMVMFVKATGALYGYDEMGVGLYNVDEQEWQGCLEDGSMYLRCLSFYNKLYQNDLVDPDSMTQGYDGAAEDYQDGVSFFSIFNYMASLLYNTDAHIAEGKAMYALAMDDQKTITYGLNVFGSSRVWTIGSQTQYPELCMEIINWLCTPEGRMISEHGPQGLTWDYDENKAPYLTELGLACNADKKTELTGGYSGTFQDGSNQMNAITWSIDATNPESDGESYNSRMWASYNATLNSDIVNDWRAFTGYTTQDEYLNDRPFAVAVGTTYTETPRSEELAIVWEQVTDCIKNYSWQAIYAENDEEFDAIVEEMKQKAVEYGYEECEAYCINEAALRKAAEDEVLK